MVDERKLAANALGGKTARACDGCLRRRARWFCPADDAFLCQACDASVHSANQLASRHARVRLETASSSRALISDGGLPIADGVSPAWHRGFTRKARTPRNGKSSKISMVNQEQQVKDMEDQKLRNPLPLVPEIGSEEEGTSCTMVVDDDSEEDRFLCRVPVFDPFDEELSDILTSKGPETEVGNEEGNAIIDSYYRQEEDDHHHQVNDVEDFPGFQLPSDMDLAKFAADVENLLGSGLDYEEEESTRNKKMGSTDFEREIDGKLISVDRGVKVKDEVVTDGQIDQLSPDHWNFDFELPVLDEAGGEEEEEEKAVLLEGITKGQSEAMKKKNMFLRLNYEAVINAWARQGSPWTTGSRPHQLGTCPKDVQQPHGGPGCRSAGAVVNEEREARVLRYKEKRRNRLFSKKIRYEVRKLNAEKRPRMKGRFVKRSSFAGTPFPYVSFN